MEMMLDLGSSVSLVQKESIPWTGNICKVCAQPGVQLVTASGEELEIVDHISAPVKLGNLQVSHKFVVVNRLVAPVILGIDFLQKHGLTLDFTTTPVGVHKSHKVVTAQQQHIPQQLKNIHGAVREAKAKVCVVAAVADETADIADECVIPRFGDTPTIEEPECPLDRLKSVVNEFNDLFRTSPGVTDEAYHHIPTSGSPVKVPPRRIPAHYRTEVEKKIQEMLRLGIIEESSSPWMAPAVFVKKKSGEIRLCVDYRELNKKTVKDAYPLPLPDEVQDQLNGSTIFSTLDLQSGFWQMPVHPADQAKTAFCPGPGMGLFQFRRMPFGLTGAPSSFQRLMDKLMRDLPFVSDYIDDLLVHSATEAEHVEHLRIVFERLRKAGLTLRGRKCRIGMSQVAILDMSSHPREWLLTPTKSRVSWTGQDLLMSNLSADS